MLDSTELLIISQLVSSRIEELKSIDQNALPQAIADAVNNNIAALINIGEVLSNQIEQ